MAWSDDQSEGMVGTKLFGGSAGMMYFGFLLTTIVRTTPIVVIPSQTYVYIRCDEVEFPIFHFFYSHGM